LAVTAAVLRAGLAVVAVRVDLSSPPQAEAVNKGKIANSNSRSHIRLGLLQF